MTDIDIMKAYEACFLGMDGCDECPFHEDDECGATHGSRLAELAFDLMNRQKEQIEQLTAGLNKYKARYADEPNKRLELAEKVAKIERNCMQGVTLELTKEQVDSMCDFLEAEFIDGIGGDASLDGNEYVESIRTVYNMLHEVSKNEG